MSAACRSCGEPIFWARTTAGKAIPVDVEETSDGNLVMEPGGVARVLPNGDPYTGPRFTSHFATCEHAKDWRRK